MRTSEHTAKSLPSPPLHNSPGPVRRVHGASQLMFATAGYTKCVHICIDTVLAPRFVELRTLLIAASADTSYGGPSFEPHREGWHFSFPQIVHAANAENSPDEWF